MKCAVCGELVHLKNFWENTKWKKVSYSHYLKILMKLSKHGTAKASNVIEGQSLKSHFMPIWVLALLNSKCFKNVNKTCANLTTYSRKPENYNGTIIFEINIMKKSPPIILNPCQTWLFHKIFDCFFCFDLQLCTLKLSWECCESSRKEVLFWFCQWQ